MEMNTTEFKKKVKELDYPYNLLYSMLWDDVKLADEIYKNRPVDFKASVEYILSWGLTTCERAVLKYRYEDKMVRSKIAKILNYASQERIRQIEAKALRKLRYPRRFKFFKYGVLGIIDNTKKDYNESLKQISEEYNIMLDNVLNDKNHLNKKPITIEDLDVSMRSYNCLKRHGINTVIELVHETPEELLNIRNLGKSSLEEIEDRLAEYDYSLKESEATEELI